MAEQPRIGKGTMPREVGDPPIGDRRPSTSPLVLAAGREVEGNGRRPGRLRGDLRRASAVLNPALYLSGLLALATMLGSCGVEGAGQPVLGAFVVGRGGVGGGSAEPTAKALGGRIENWTGEPARVQAQVYDAESNLAVLATARLGADGEFRLALPGARGVAGSLSPVTDKNHSCGAFGGVGDLKITPNRVEIAEISLVVASDAGAGWGALSYSGFSAGSVFFVKQLYAASAATITGRCTYLLRTAAGAAQTHIDTYFLELKAGWNTVVYEHLDEKTRPSRR